MFSFFSKHFNNHVANSSYLVVYPHTLCDDVYKFFVLMSLNLFFLGLFYCLIFFLNSNTFWVIYILFVVLENQNLYIWVVRLIDIVYKCKQLSPNYSKPKKAKMSFFKHLRLKRLFFIFYQTKMASKLN